MKFPLTTTSFGVACLCAAAMLTSGWAADKKAPVTIWTAPETAAAEHPDFLLQGEYVGDLEGKPVGLQAADLDEGKFLVAIYQGGLPGAGWDQSKINSQLLDREALKFMVADLERVERESETLGLKPADGAMIIFNGEATDLVKGEIKDGYLWAGSETTQPVGSFVLHLEYRLPFKPARLPSSQDRGNSGVYIFNNYECQVLDSFGLDLVEENNPFEVESRNSQWCGSFYKVKTPDIHMVYPPLRWQTLDIDFTAPEFEGEKKVKNARITVRHNGVVIHDDFELEIGTGAGAKRPEKEKGMIFLQGHGNPVAYRNFWLKEK